MASVQAKISRSGKKTYYVVESLGRRRKWIRTKSLQEAKKIKRHLESADKSQLMEKLGITIEETYIDDFFQEYIDYVRLHNAPNSVKRYSNVLNTFLTFLKMFHPQITYVSQISRDIIESYQKQRINSIELKIAADGVKIGLHKNKKLPQPQTVNYEINVLRTAFIWAQDRELVAEVPTRKVKKFKVQHRINGKILSADQCKLFLETASKIAERDKRMEVMLAAFKFICIS